MVGFVICAIATLFRIYLIYKFAYILLGEVKKEKRYRIIVLGCFYVMKVILFWKFHLVWGNIVCNLVGISAIVWLYTKHARTNIFVTSTIYLLNIGCDVASTSPFINYKDGELYSQLYAVMSVFFFFICKILTEKMITVYKNTESVHNFSLIYVPLCSAVMICFLVYTNTCTGVGIVAVGLGLLSVNFFMLYLYNQLRYLISWKYEAGIMEQKVQIYARQLATITQSEEKVKALRHDMKHHMNEIRLLAGKYGASDIQEYIDKMENFAGVSGEVQDSGNIEIDSILNYMLQKARKELREVKVKVKLPEKLEHSFEVNVLIGNLLENAIEAAGETAGKYLNVCIEFEKGVLRILVENSFHPADQKHKERNQKERIPPIPETPPKHHGIGLNNVKKIVEFYHGIMEIRAKGDIFIVDIMLYMEG